MANELKGVTLMRCDIFRVCDGGGSIMVRLARRGVLG